MAQIQRSFRDAVIFFDVRQLFPAPFRPTTVPQDTALLFEEQIAAPIQKFLRGKGLAEEVFLKSTQDFVVLTLLDSVLFLPGSLQLQPRAQALLRTLSELLRDVSVTISIEGHTDPGADNATGWYTTALKAARVMNFLRTECNIPQTKLCAAGFSHYRPFVPHASLEERRRNRRIDIVIPLDQEFFSKRGGITNSVPPSFKVWDLRAQRRETSCSQG